MGYVSQMFRGKKSYRKLFYIFAVFIGLIVGAGLLGYGNSYYGYSRLVASIQVQLDSGNEKVDLAKLFPDSKWDRICIIPPHSFSRLVSGDDRINKFFDGRQHPLRLLLPDTLNEKYGLGFSLLNKDAVIGIYKIPTYTKIWEGFRFAKKPTTFQIESKTILLADIRVSFDENDLCMDNDAAYISFTDLLITNYWRTE